MENSHLLHGTCTNRVLLVAFLAMTPLMVGCGDSGPAGVPVHGAVTYKGDLLERGVVLFNPTDRELSAARADIQPDGTYQITTLPGEYKVVVNLFTKTDSSLEPDQPGYKEPKSMLPAKYSSLVRTPLVFTVEDQANQIDLEL